MIIVSQDKDAIVNFDSVEIIGIGNPLEDDNGKFKILCDAISDQYVMGKYDTEERVKEVLQEIIKEYLYCNEQDCMNNIGYVQNRIYEMPKE